MQHGRASITPLAAAGDADEEHAMTPSAVPARITIDFRDAMHPSRTWILGVGEVAPSRVELLAFETPPAPASRSGQTGWMPRARPTALSADCLCPEFCERDHANE
jgi:hypothetical protein